MYRDLEQYRDENVVIVPYVSLNPQIYLFRLIPCNFMTMSGVVSLLRYPCAVVYFFVYLAIMLFKRSI